MLLVALAFAGCAGPEHGCVPTMAELKVGMTKADAINAWCYPSTTTKTEQAIPVFDPASLAGPLAGSTLMFDENGRLVTVSEAHH